MSKFLHAVIVLLLFLVPMSLLAAVADGYEAGVSAYQQGNYLKAKSIFKRLAQQGHVESQVRLGELYDKGKGVARNFEKAVKWYRIAALQRYPKAQYNLGVKYMNGHGVPKNVKLAYAWFAVALDNGFAKAAQPLKFLNQTMPTNIRQEALLLASGELSALTHEK